MKATVKAFDGWVKDNGLEKPIKGGYFDNDFIDAKGVKKVKDLPTLPDLMLRLCVSLNLAGSLGIAKAIKAYKAHDTSLCTAIGVRVYDRTNNAMREVTLGDILVHFQNIPPDTKTNGAGQIHLRDDMYVSGAIISMIRAVYNALEFQ